jgi:hypothetical protein
MRTTLKGVLIGAVLLVSAGQAFAYPPDNAAVLYYKTFMLLMKEPNDAEENMLRQFSKDDTRINEQVRLYLEGNRKVIKEIITAAEIKNCDWGLDLSEGFSTPLPPLAKCRHAAYLLAADAKVLAEKGDYKTALERCITMHKMGRHVGDDIIVQGLVGIAIGGLADRRIVEILPQVSDNSEMLQWLRSRLADVSGRRPSIRTAIGNEAIVCGNSIKNKEGLRGIVADVCGISRDDQDKLDKILHQQGDNEFYIRAREYYQSIIARMQIAYGLPFPQAKQALENLNKEVENTAKEKSEAVIAEVLLPAINRVLIIDTRDKTQFNAVLAGVDIYLIRAKTGKLPDGLPAGLPKDMFSGKDFLYEKTDAGFTLTGQGKDLDKDIVQKYEFKVAK